MAIRATLAALLMFLLMASPVKACTTLDYFVSKIRAADPVVMLARADATKRIVEVVNKNRANVGREPIKASVFLLAAFIQPDGSVVLGVVLFDDDGCAIEETAVVLTQKQWNDFAGSVGLTEDDFAVLNES